MFGDLGYVIMVSFQILFCFDVFYDDHVNGFVVLAWCFCSLYITLLAFGAD